MLNEKLNLIQDNLRDTPELSITYFISDKKKSGGSYTTVTGDVKRIDDYEQLLLLMDGTKIPIADILDIDGDVFKLLATE